MESMVEKLFKYREENFVDEIEQDMYNLKNRLKDINTNQMQKMIDKIPDENRTLKDDLYRCLENLVADYNITMAYYNKKYYKQGFFDAVQYVGNNYHTINRVEENT